jgi:ATP-dependent RNA helicase SUPV3L1/SUV3
MAANRDAVERLWEVCQVPDYRKIAPATHAELVATLYGFLMRAGKIPVDWFSSQVAQADRTDGDIDTLSNRIAHVRTWTFIANRPDWLADPEHWQAVTRGVEDKLSDALHERLTERFVDRRTSVLMRRLRENTTLDTEIKKTGEVVVEGHEIGRLDGFSFAADAAAAAGSEAKALHAAARSALAGEIDARAVKVSQAPDREFVLASDSTLRWTGAAVGKLVPGEDVLRPRVRLIADEQLTGASRDTVQTRLDLWLKNHIERLLGPLFALAAAEDVTGIARGVAFQLIESLGVLERQKVAEDVKGLDQASRANLRKYGVRFGAYHLYLPVLLKPAPRSLAAQLWMLKHESPEAKGLDDLQRLAGSGRTSIPVDHDTPKALYRTIGYRVCGERAIRVDILERLADLIRPALGWREGSPGARPPGAFSGFGFTVTGAMTSLTGASGEDFASILRSLGYRMEKRLKPPEPVTPEPVAAATPEAPAEPAPATEVPSSSDSDTAMEAAVGDAGPAPAEAASSEAAPPAETVVEQSAATEPSPPEQVAASESTAAPAAAEPTAPADTGPMAAESAAASDAAAPATSDAAPATPAEPEMIEVWRPGRPSGERRPREGEPRNRRRRHDRGAARSEGQPAGEAAVAASPGTEAAPAPDGEAQRQEPRPERRGRPRHRRRDNGGAAKPGEPGQPSQPGEQRAERPERQPRPPRKDRNERNDRPDRGDRPPRRDRDRDRRDDSRPSRTWSSSQDQRGKEPDPNSPFAKLLALKAQLEANKEPQ